MSIGAGQHTRSQHGVKVVRPVAKGQSLVWDDVEMDTTTDAYKIRRAMEDAFAPQAQRQ